MVLTSAGAVMANFVSNRRKSNSNPAASEQSSEETTTNSSTEEPAVTSSVGEGAVRTVSVTPSHTSMKLVMLMFWAGVVVGIVVSGLAAARLYTLSMAEREEKMVRELLEQEARMEQEKADRFWLGLAIASCISVLAVVQSYRMKMAEREACAKNQQRLKNLLVERMSRKPAPPPEDEVPVERLHCVVCLTAQREVILLDCGHVCACRQCADTLLREDHLCPVCRADIRQVKPAFIS